jgi:2-iminobutanoate/2-iminopropanoate deaminase
MRVGALYLLAVAFSMGCEPGASARQPVEYIPMPGGSRLPFSAAARVGPMLYLSGQLGTDTTGKLVPGGIEAETRQALENVRSILERSGSSLDRVVKCTAMLADMADWPAMNRVYVSFFPRHLPARSAFGANGLALGARIELECWAAAGGD